MHCDVNPYAPPPDTEWAGRSDAEKLARTLVESGAAVGSVRYRLTKLGAPVGVAHEIAIDAVRQRKLNVHPSVAVGIAFAVFLVGPIFNDIIVMIGSYWP